MQMDQDFFKLVISKTKIAVGITVSSTLLMACSQGVKFELPAANNNFAQNIAYNNKVDILWVMDNSSSMQKHQQDLSSQIPDLVSKLDSLKLDYHMAVITSSMGGTNPNGGHFMGSPRILTNSSPNMTLQLSTRLVVGRDGSNNNRGLDSMEAVLSPNYLKNEGQGFLRDDALLVVIALSDGDDKSKSENIAVNYFKDFLNSIKPPHSDGSQAWIFNFIGVLKLNTTCTTFDDYSEPGVTFMGLVNASGGTMGSICTSSLPGAVSNIRARVIQILTDFKLSSKPLESSIVVKINGQVIPRSNVNGWDYIPSLNVVRFFGSAIPAVDVAIAVDFKPAEAN